MKQTIKKSFCFIANNTAVVSIEIAFIASSFIVLIMAIIEFSVIFSIRGGLEELSRDLSRQKSSVSGGQAINNSRLASRRLAEANGHDFNSQLFSEDTVFSSVLISKLKNILPKYDNIEVCITIYKETQDIIDDMSTQNCNMISEFIWMANFGFGASTEFTRLEIKYTHEYVTPLGHLISTIGDNVYFSTVSYFRKETIFNEDV